MYIFLLLSFFFGTYDDFLLIAVVNEAYRTFFGIFSLMFDGLFSGQSALAILAIRELGVTGVVSILKLLYYPIPICSCDDNSCILGSELQAELNPPSSPIRGLIGVVIALE